MPTLDAAGLDLLFLRACTQNGWLPTPVSEDELRRLWDIVKMGPTSANSLPARCVFLRTPAAKARRPSVWLYFTEACRARAEILLVRAQAILMRSSSRSCWPNSVWAT